MSATSKIDRAVARAAMLMALLFVAACAGGSGAARPAPGTESVTASRNRLDSAQMAGRDFGSVYQAILATHPDWLSPARGTTSVPVAGKPTPTPQVGVFIDGSQRSQGIEYLKQVKPEIVRSIRHLSASESKTEFGSDWQWGAILVTLRR